jgi:aminopeptidase N
MAVKIILALAADVQQGRPLQLDDAYVAAMQKVLLDEQLDKALVAAALSLPAEAYLAEFMSVIDPLAIHQARLFVRQTLADRLREHWHAQYQANCDDGAYEITATAMGQRALKNVCLAYLMELDAADSRELCLKQYSTAQNMTDVMAALGCLNHHAGAEREQALVDFYTKWQDEALVVDKWFSLQAVSRLPDTLQQVKALMQHPAFTLKNPNKVRALIGAFCNANLVNFHDASGAGYEFLADQVLTLDKLNPQVAARMSNGLSQWRKYDGGRQRLMQAQLQRMLAEPGLSRDVYEVVSKSLG